MSNPDTVTAITQNGVLQKDDNGYPVMGGTSSADNSTVINSSFNPSTRRLLTDASGGGTGTGTWWKVNGTIDGVNATFTISTAAGSDFLLFLNRQLQAQDVGADVWDYTYSVLAGVTTIVYNSPPDASLSGTPHQAFVIS